MPRAANPPFSPSFLLEFVSAAYKDRRSSHLLHSYTMLLLPASSFFPLHLPETIEEGKLCVNGTQRPPDSSSLLHLESAHTETTQTIIFLLCCSAPAYRDLRNSILARSSALSVGVTQNHHLCEQTLQCSRHGAGWKPTTMNHGKQRPLELPPQLRSLPLPTPAKIIAAVNEHLPYSCDLS